MSFAARLSNVTEAVPPAVDVVDVSRGGALLSYGEPLGLMVDERVVISMKAVEVTVMLLGRVVRIARGTDFRTYVAVHFDDDQCGELDLLDAELDRFEACRRRRVAQPTTDG